MASCPANKLPRYSRNPAIHNARSGYERAAGRFDRDDDIFTVAEIVDESAIGSLWRCRITVAWRGDGS